MAKRSCESALVSTESGDDKRSRIKMGRLWPRTAVVHSPSPALLAPPTF